MRGTTIRQRIGDVIFGTDARAGRAFDVVLLWAILISVAAVMLESVESIRARHGAVLSRLEWTFTIAFTVEYILRVYAARDRRRYVFSFFGLVDLLAVLPTYLGLVLPKAQYALVLRSLRLLRVFRVLKLVHFLDDADLLLRALRASREKIFVFLFGVLTFVLIAAAFMYVIEGPENGFDNIPLSVYWAIVTITTVGYGDFIPLTALGRFLSSVLMITGYAIIAVPTGIVTTEIGRANSKVRGSEQECARCRTRSHPEDANYCHVCGERLPAEA